MARKTVTIGNKKIGDGYPTFIIGEIGINHNGDIEIAKKLIDVSTFAGVDAIKFQKRNPEFSTPEKQKNKLRETPWGTMKYIDYKKKIEFEKPEYDIIQSYATEKKMIWFASPWDEDSVDFLEQYDLPAFKMASASLTDHKLLKKVRKLGKPIIISTGMSTMQQIEEAVNILGGTDNLIIMHCNSSYPAKQSELNLRVITTLQEKFDCPIGYSGHETGLQTTYAAVTLGAAVVERHITVNRTMWGTDQAASIEPFGLMRLVRDIRVVEEALGDGEKRVYDSEEPVLLKLRRVDDTQK